MSHGASWSFPAPAFPPIGVAEPRPRGLGDFRAVVGMPRIGNSIALRVVARVLAHLLAHLVLAAHAVDLRPADPRAVAAVGPVLGRVPVRARGVEPAAVAVVRMDQLVGEPDAGRPPTIVAETVKPIAIRVEIDLAAPLRLRP